KVILTSGLSSLRLAEVRSTGAFALLALGLLAVRPENLRLRAHELPLLVAFGAGGLALVQWFYFLAIHRLAIGIALLIEYLAPVLVALWARFVLHQPVRQRIWVALACAVAGLALVVEIWSGLSLDAAGDRRDARAGGRNRRRVGLARRVAHGGAIGRRRRRSRGNFSRSERPLTAICEVFNLFRAKNLVNIPASCGGELHRFSSLG